MLNHSNHRNSNKTLGVTELIAIALGGMVGGGIFTILGISVSMVGVYTPLVIVLGGVTTSLAAYTFASYAISGFSFADNELVRKLVAGAVILIFTLINIWSVKGMGKIEDIMVYTKLVVLAIISFVLINNSQTTLPVLIQNNAETSALSVFIVASITFVAYEGFQLVINAVNEMENPDKNIPKAIYTALFLTVLIYFVISLGAILTIPFDSIIQNKEYALAAGAEKILGHWGTDLVILGALLATSSAINGTLFGASRQMAVIATDGYFPALIAKRSKHIPIFAILSMATFAFLLVLAGSLEVILEFGSITFLLVSLLMAFANFKIRNLTGSSTIITVLSILGLLCGTILIFYYEFNNQPQQLFFIGGLYALLTVGSWLYSRKKSHQSTN